MTISDTDHRKQAAEVAGLAAYCKAAGLSPARVVTICVYEMARSRPADTAAALRDLANAVDLIAADEPTGSTH